MTVVYRLFTEDSQLLYVGVSDNLPSRFASHASDWQKESWWNKVSYHTTIEYETREEALIAEAQAILSEEPLHNVSGASERRKAEIKKKKQDKRDEENRLANERRREALEKIEAKEARWEKYRNRYQLWVKVHPDTNEFLLVERQDEQVRVLASLVDETAVHRIAQALLTAWQYRNYDAFKNKGALHNPVEFHGTNPSVLRSVSVSLGDEGHVNLSCLENDDDEVIENEKLTGK